MGFQNHQKKIVRCKQKLRNCVFKYTSNLKDLRNSSGDAYYVNAQLPEPLQTAKREREAKMRAIKKANEQLPEDQKHRRTPVYIKNNTLFVNKVAQKQHVQPPTVQEIFNCDLDCTDRMDRIDFVHSTAILDKKSTFTGHAARVKSSKDVNAAYTKICRLYPESDHIILAYAVKNYTGSHDHGEHSAGSRILNILTQRGMNNTVLFVTREFGGIHLGHRRFLHIERAARDALDHLMGRP